MTVDKMNDFSEFYKLLALLISDRISSLLKLNCDMKDLVCKEESFKKYTDSISSFSFVGLFKYKNRGILVFFDPKIVYSLTNRMMGGKGEIEAKNNPIFTFSETTFGKEMMSWITSYYNKQNIPVEFIRIENYLKHIHYFFADESIVNVKMNCKVNDIKVGAVSICHPLQFVDQERLKCDII